MNSSIEELKQKFLVIRNLGWIKSDYNTLGGLGNMFEKLINKEEDNFPVPDYKGIEIKTINKFTNDKIHLFSIAPDGDYLYPTQRVLDILGYPDKNYPNYKVFNVSVKANEYKTLGFNRKIKLVVNRKMQKLDLVGYDLDGDNLNINVSWSFKFLEERLKLKLSYLAIIYGESKIRAGERYYKYNWINFYKLNNFERFLSLIESGDIWVTFKISFFKDERKFGTIHDRGTDFSINISNINKMFDKLMW